MITIFYTRSVHQLNAKTFDFFFQQLPIASQSQVSKYRRWQDSQRSLLGKALLATGLQSLGFGAYSLKDLQFTSLQKPYFDDVIHFNIAHSGDYVVCAISKTNKLGVDVEEIKDIPILDFVNEFSGEELADMQQATDPLRSFYAYWTKKEAFLKAVGSGLNTPLNEVAIKEDKIIWKGEEWFLQELALDQNYVAHLATDVPFPEIHLKKIDFG